MVFHKAFSQFLESIDQPGRESEMTQTHPLVSAIIKRAHKNREERFMHYYGGATLKGFDELLNYLTSVELMFRANTRLKDIAFLIVRAQGDFETALETTLSGLHAVVFDSMRDIMEIEFLLRDFVDDASHINEWLTLSDRKRREKFDPAVLRKRFAERQGSRPEDMIEAQDYKAHSRYLHVTPYTNPFGSPGFVDDSHPGMLGACFWEILEHGQRLIFVIYRLLNNVETSEALSEENGPNLPLFHDAWERSKIRHALWNP
jgi:hypothetical protein